MNISVTGHRNFDRELFAETLMQQILRLANGEQAVLWCGMAVGFDLAAAEATLELRRRGLNIRLHCVVPYVGQALFFSSEDLGRYEAVLRAADRVVTLAQEYSRDIFYRRNDYLVEMADVVLAYYDGERGSGTAYTVRRAHKERVAVVNIYPQQQLSLF